MKKSFSLLELLFVITLISIIYFFYKPYKSNSSLELAANRLTLYLKQTRYQALIENKYSSSDSLWYKQNWTLKFFRCSSSVGGFYYSIYTDLNKKGHPNLEESLKDPLSNLYIYSDNKCEEKLNRSKFVLLTKEFGIKDIKISCNSTSSIGQISFGNDAQVYTKLSSDEEKKDEYKLDDDCIIDLYDDKNNKESIKIVGKTGFVYRI